MQCNIAPNLLANCSLVFKLNMVLSLIGTLSALPTDSFHEGPVMRSSDTSFDLSLMKLTASGIAGDLRHHVIALECTALPSAKHLQPDHTMMM